MDGWKNGGMDGWMEGGMDGWIVGRLAVNANGGL